MGGDDEEYLCGKSGEKWDSTIYEISDAQLPLHLHRFIITEHVPDGAGSLVWQRQRHLPLPLLHLHPTTRRAEIGLGEVLLWLGNLVAVLALDSPAPHLVEPIFTCQIAWLTQLLACQVLDWRRRFQAFFTSHPTCVFFIKPLFARLVGKLFVFIFTISGAAIYAESLVCAYSSWDHWPFVGVNVSSKSLAHTEMEGVPWTFTTATGKELVPSPWLCFDGDEGSEPFRFTCCFRHEFGKQPTDTTEH